MRHAFEPPAEAEGVVLRLRRLREVLIGGEHRLGAERGPVVDEGERHVAAVVHGDVLRAAALRVGVAEAAVVEQERRGVLVAEGGRQLQGLVEARAVVPVRQHEARVLAHRPAHALEVEHVPAVPDGEIGTAVRAGGPAADRRLLPAGLRGAGRRVAVDLVDAGLKGRRAVVEAAGIGRIERVRRHAVDIGLEDPALRLGRIVDRRVLHRLHGGGIEAQHLRPRGRSEVRPHAPGLGGGCPRDPYEPHRYPTRDQLPPRRRHPTFMHHGCKPRLRCSARSDRSVKNLAFSLAPAGPFRLSF